MAGLHSVADHLSSHANALGSVDTDADAFGRSAFNRYYYETYLTVRDLLVTIDAAWGKTPHAKIPDHLEKSLVNRIKETAKRQKRTGMLTPSRNNTIVYQTMSAATNIASILKSAYSVRVAADYEPTHKIVFRLVGFELDSCSIGEANSWYSRVEREKGKLIAISRELGLVA